MQRLVVILVYQIYHFYHEYVGVFVCYTTYTYYYPPSGLPVWQVRLDRWRCFEVRTEVGQAKHRTELSWKAAREFAWTRQRKQKYFDALVCELFTSPVKISFIVCTAMEGDVAQTVLYLCKPATPIAAPNTHRSGCTLSVCVCHYLLESWLDHLDWILGANSLKGSFQFESCNHHYPTSIYVCIATTEWKLRCQKRVEIARRCVPLPLFLHSSPHLHTHAIWFYHLIFVNAF